MKRLLPIAAAALLLTACGAPDSEPAHETASSATVASTVSTSTTTTSSKTIAAPASEIVEESHEPVANHSDVNIDQLVITPNTLAEHGVYLDPDSGDYYYCNPTFETWGGVAPGECDGPYDYNGANAKFQTVVENWYSDTLEENGLPSPNDAVFSYCSGDGIAMYTDGNEHPYSDCAQPPAPATDPSPWVQGQIDWQNCLDAGNAEEYCRETLN